MFGTETTLRIKNPHSNILKYLDHPIIHWKTHDFQVFFQPKSGKSQLSITGAAPWRRSAVVAVEIAVSGRPRLSWPRLGRCGAPPRPRPSWRRAVSGGCDLKMFESFWIWNMEILEIVFPICSQMETKLRIFTVWVVFFLSLNGSD